MTQPSLIPTMSGRAAAVLPALSGLVALNIAWFAPSSGLAMAGALTAGLYCLWQLAMHTPPTIEFSADGVRIADGRRDRVIARDQIIHLRISNLGAAPRFDLMLTESRKVTLPVTASVDWMAMVRQALHAGIPVRQV